MNSMQKEFDIVVKHLYKQGRPALNVNGITCEYLTETGLMCAVGCRIPKKLNDGSLQGTVRGLIEDYPTELLPEIYAYAVMFNDLQLAHDMCSVNLDGTFNSDDLEARLKVIAKEFNLTFTIPNTSGEQHVTN